jgi:hypothetical protein
VYHQVLKTSADSQSVVAGPVSVTYVNISYFDWEVVHTTGSSNDLATVVSDDPNIYTNTLFYMPVWIQTWTNMVLEAVTPTTAYSMQPLRNPNNPYQFLIPGNLFANQDNITLRYHIAGSTDRVWHYFVMEFQTLTPSQYRYVATKQVAVVLNPDYINQNVNAFYATGVVNQVIDQSQPFPIQIPMQNLVGIFPANTNASGWMTDTNQAWWLNSKYDLSGLKNYLQGALPVLPLSSY